MDATAYNKVLEGSLLPFMEDKYPYGAHFQQDNAPVIVASDCFMNIDYST